MKLKRNSIALPLYLLLITLLTPGEVKGQDGDAFRRYSEKYPDNSIILTSYKEDMVIRMANGKPEMDITEFKELLALNDNAGFFADSRENFGSVYQYRGIEAYSLVPENGSYRKIPVKSFNKTTDPPNGLFYDDIISYNFTFPSVVKGSWLVSKTRMLSTEPEFAYRFFFGDYFPCDNYCFTITCPENVDIRYKVYGRDTSIINFSLRVKGGKKIYSWQASNPKSYIRDDDAPGISYYMPHVVIQISQYSYRGKTTVVNNSLDDLYRIAYDRVSKINLTESKELKSLTDSLTNGVSSDIEKVKRIYNWVQKNVKYVAFEDGANGYVPREAYLVLQRKYGDCKDKTSILVAMLKSQGLKASYAWIGSRDIAYRFSDFATDYDSNHMIAVWWDENDNPVILDGTTRHHRLEDIPTFIQGKECLIERGPDKFKVYTIPVSAPEKNCIYDSLTVELKEDTLVGYGYTAINGERRPFMMESFDGKKPADLPERVTKLVPKASNKFIIESVKPIETTDNDSVFRYTYKFYLADYLATYNNVSYLNLNLDRFPSDINIKSDRWMPFQIDYTQQHIFVCTFKIPAGYEVRDIPKNSSYENKLFGYTQSYSVNGSEIKLKTIVTLNFLVIEDADISLLREMLGQLNSNYNKTIPIYKTVTK